MSLPPASEILATARRYYPDEDEDFIATEASMFATLSYEDYALLEISCSVCHQHRSIPMQSRYVLVSSLSAECQFCNILRTCQQRFGRDCNAMRIYFQEPENDMQICFREESKEDTCKEIHVQLYSEESRDKRSPFPCARDICESAGSEAAIGIMKDWLNRCDTTHQHAPPTHAFKPTRLIKLTSTGAQLFSPETPVPYAALFYRWGHGTQSETTTKNLSQRSQALQTMEFPKTLQDAIHVTRGLGLEYIWIDRVCIVQDDGDDWAKEASLMAGIYASAHIVLSATATDDCADGFLHKRPDPLVIPYVQRSQENSLVRARRIESHECFRDRAKTNYTLFQRGWCMQERFLARRVIHFLPDEILFECQAGRECECDAARTEKTRYDILDAFRRFIFLRAAKYLTEREFAWAWSQITRAYSAAQITYGKDSLPALSGVAACMEHLKLGKYIAGLWEYGIGFHLGWHVDPSSGARRWKYPEDIDIRGPSFAWTSHARSVQHAVLDFPLQICTLQSSHVELTTANPYGEVGPASMCLRGHIVSAADLIPWLKVPELRYAISYLYFDSGVQISDPGFEPNPPDDEHYGLKDDKTGEPVMLFGISESKAYGTIGQVDALLLRPSRAGAGEYVRIGLFRGLEKTWFDEHAVASTVTII